MTLVATATVGFTGLSQNVLDYDPAGISGVGTDFAFDFSQARSFVAGRPSDGVAITGGVLSVTIAAGGTGGTTGTHPLTFSGGGGTGATGTATIAGGVVISVAVTNAGTGYTTVPTVSVVGVGLNSANLQAAIGTVSNLARDTNTLLSRTLPVVGVWRSGSARPVRSGAGLLFAPTTNLGIAINKGGVANNRVCEPTLEGFLDQLVLINFRATGFASSASPFVVGTSSGANQTGGWLQSGTSGDFSLAPSRVNVSGWTDGVVAGALTQLGYLTRYDVGGNTTEHYLIRDGQFRSTPLVGTAPASMLSNIANAAANIGGGGTAGPVVFNGVIYSLYREFVEVAGLTNDDVAGKVARAWAYAQGAFD